MINKLRQLISDSCDIEDVMRNGGGISIDGQKYLICIHYTGLPCDIVISIFYHYDNYKRKNYIEYSVRKDELITLGCGGGEALKLLQAIRERIGV